MLYSVNGEWVFISQNYGKLFEVTHSQVKELMSGIKNDAYEDDYGAEMDLIVKTASTNPGRLSDLAIRVPATHTPGNNSL